MCLDDFSTENVILKSQWDLQLAVRQATCCAQRHSDITTQIIVAITMNDSFHVNLLQVHSWHELREGGWREKTPFITILRRCSSSAVTSRREHDANTTHPLVRNHYIVVSYTTRNIEMRGWMVILVVWQSGNVPLLRYLRSFLQYNATQVGSNLSSLVAVGNYPPTVREFSDLVFF